MLRSVLVPLDGSTLSEAILPVMETLLVDAEAQVLLVSVVADHTRASVEDELDRRTDYLSKTQARLEAAGLKVETRLERGDPADRILHVAEDVRADLIAMATHGWSGVTRMVRGSVAERILRHARPPLLLANPTALAQEESRALAFQRLLVPLDGSDRADRILPFVEVMATTFRSEVTLLFVEPFEPYVTGELASPMVSAPLWNPEAVKKRLEPQRARLLEAGIKTVTIEARLGVAAREILRVAEASDLVLMTTHGRSGVSRWVFGSVAEQVLRHCDRPLLVVRTPD